LDRLLGGAKRKDLFGSSVLPVERLALVRIMEMQMGPPKRRAPASSNGALPNRLEREQMFSFDALKHCFY
jgi:hypothetical protein